MPEYYLPDVSPISIEILIYAPNLSRRGWFVAMKKVRNGCSGFRWHVQNYPGKGNYAWMSRDWEPELWRQLEKGEVVNGID